MSNPGDAFHIKGIADENHEHRELAQRQTLLEAKLRELRCEWDEFIAAMQKADQQKDAPSFAGLIGGDQ